METDCSLSYLQNLAIGPYPVSDESSPNSHTLLLLRSVLILSAHVRLRHPSCLIPLGFPIKILCELFISPTHLYAALISSYLL
jgi:hypothetical protein